LSHVLTEALSLCSLAPSAQLAYGCADGAVMSYAQMYKNPSDLNFSLCSLTRYSAPCVHRMLDLTMRVHPSRTISSTILSRSWLAGSEHLTRANIFGSSVILSRSTGELVVWCSQFVATQPSRALNATEQLRWLACVHGSMYAFSRGAYFLATNASLQNVQIYCATLLAVEWQTDELFRKKSFALCVEQGFYTSQTICTWETLKWFDLSVLEAELVGGRQLLS